MLSGKIALVSPGKCDRTHMLNCMGNCVNMTKIEYYKLMLLLFLQGRKRIFSNITPLSTDIVKYFFWKHIAWYNPENVDTDA